MKEVICSNYLQSQYDSYSHRAFIRGIYSVCIIIGSIILAAFIPVAALVSSIVGIMVLASAGSLNNAKRVFGTGMQGENTLREYLNNLLSDQYTAFYNVPTGYGDIDCVVTGPTGIYAFEVKNHKGLIGYKDGRWSQIKIGRGGTAYRGSLKNPSDQLVSGIMRLRERLSMEGINAWINGCVVFTNPETRLSVEGLKNIKAVQIANLNQVFTQSPTVSNDKLAKIEDVICKIDWK